MIFNGPSGNYASCAAFITIDHPILLKVLENYFGIIDPAHKWFASYLSGRKQSVLINDYTSDDFHLSCGVPQGDYIM